MIVDISKRCSLIAPSSLFQTVIEISISNDINSNLPAIFDILEYRANDKSRNVLQFVRSCVCTEEDNSIMISADRPVNNMSHVVKTEKTSDFVVDWYFTSYESRIPKFMELRFTFHE